MDALGHALHEGVHATQSLPLAQHAGSLDVLADEGNSSAHPEKRRKMVDDGRHLFACELCGERFTRFENLKRHKRNHEATSVEVCPCCQVKCKRPDLLKRHVKKFHPEEVPRLYPKAAAGMTSVPPEQFATTDAAQTLTSLAMPSQIDPAIQMQQEHGLLMNGLHGFIPSLMQSTNGDLVDRLPDMPFTEAELQAFTALYFKHFHSSFPILHEASFGKSFEEMPWLQLPVACIGALYTQDLSHQKRSLSVWMDLIGIIKTYELDESRGDTTPLALASLLLCYYGIFLGNTQTHTAALELHAARVFQQRRLGLSEDLQAQSDSGADLPSLWQAFISREGKRRCIYGMLLLDLQTSLVFGTPMVMRSSEIRLGIPCTESAWNAPTAEAWATSADMAIIGRSLKDIINAVLQDRYLPSAMHGFRGLVIMNALLKQIHDGAASDLTMGYATIPSHDNRGMRAEYEEDCKRFEDGIKAAMQKMRPEPRSAFHLSIAAVCNLALIHARSRPLLFMSRGLHGRTDLLRMLTEPNETLTDCVIEMSLMDVVKGMFGAWDSPLTSLSATRRDTLATIALRIVEVSTSLKWAVDHLSNWNQSASGQDRVEDPVTLVMLLRCCLAAGQLLQILECLQAPDAGQGRGKKQKQKAQAEIRAEIEAAVNKIFGDRLDGEVNKSRAFLLWCIDKTRDMRAWRLGEHVVRAVQATGVFETT